MDVFSVTTTDLRAGLTALHGAAKSLPMNWVLLGHCMFCTTLADDFHGVFLLHYWLSFIAGFGGGISTSFLLMRPDIAPINIFASNAAGLMWTVCWWATNYAPTGILGKIQRYWPVMMVTRACTHFMRANLIITRVDQMSSLYPGVILAPLVVGTLAGCGGRLITDAIRSAKGVKLPGCMEWETQSYSSRSSFTAAALYYFTVHHFSVLKASEAAAIVLLLIVGHSLVYDLTGWDLDYTKPLFAAIHKLSNIPVYERNGKAGAGAGAGKAVVRSEAAAAAPAGVDGGGECDGVVEVGRVAGAVGTSGKGRKRSNGKRKSKDQ